MTLFIDGRLRACLPPGHARKRGRSFTSAEPHFAVKTVEKEVQELGKRHDMRDYRTVMNARSCRVMTRSINPSVNSSQTTMTSFPSRGRKSYLSVPKMLR
ncbi:hypothetical protein E2C01_010816 [Portunus trituberculatus]|uniref:Uncharacterized protein n=1 Tax=Portunus trituberculatus TaxID=210409 RepID=A0A5B7D9V6_PORTR|nr:hypothetical protein [Portunus trituberculatus]